MGHRVMLTIIRIFIGLVLLVSGFEKLMSPYQNFLYVIQAYAMFPLLPGIPGWSPSGLEKLAALSVPWVELMAGIFLSLGLWTDWSLKGALLLFGSFIVIVGQALLRGLPIDQCGCFGENIHILPQYIIVFDSVMLLSIFWLLRHPSKTKIFSLDNNLK